MNWNFGNNATLDQSLMNLAATHDARDQMTQDIHRFQNTGVGDVSSMLEARKQQIDCRDQEYQDIQTFLNGL